MGSAAVVVVVASIVVAVEGVVAGIGNVVVVIEVTFVASDSVVVENGDVVGATLWAFEQPTARMASAVTPRQTVARRSESEVRTRASCPT